jgi:predicted DNA-binding ribbon-helix-helix protein
MFNTGSDIAVLKTGTTETAPPKNIQATERHMKSSLVSRNVTLNGHRTSMRLEPAVWQALSDIGRREKLNIHQLCSMVADHKSSEASFTAAVRVFSMEYFRAASTEEGHRQAGHGSAFVFTAKRDLARMTGQRGIITPINAVTPIKTIAAPEPTLIASALIARRG